MCKTIWSKLVMSVPRILFKIFINWNYIIFIKFKKILFYQYLILMQISARFIALKILGNVDKLRPMSVSYTIDGSRELVDQDMKINILPMPRIR